jgi:hypothetical protein
MWIPRVIRIYESLKTDFIGAVSRAKCKILNWKNLVLELICLSRELRLEAGLPGSGINECRYPHIFPAPPSLEQPNLSATGGESISFQGASFETDRAHLVTGWFFYLGEIALKRLGNRILLYRYGDQSDSSGRGSEEENDLDLRRSVLEFDLQLDQWYVSGFGFLGRPSRLPTEIPGCYLTTFKDAISPTTNAVFSYICRTSARHPSMGTSRTSH